jgi:uncharacterized DUF497 family protein
MEFEWDAEKASRNFDKHGVVFKHAANVFLDPARADARDERHNYGEERRLVFGKIDGELYAVVYTSRGRVIRLISARKANDRERMKYDCALHARPE